MREAYWEDVFSEYEALVRHYIVEQQSLPAFINAAIKRYWVACNDVLEIVDYAALHEFYAGLSF